MMYPDVAAVEEALVERLKADQRLIAWNAQITSLPAINKDSWARLFARFPAVGTYCAQGSYEENPTLRATVERCPLALLCAGGGYRTAADARKGGLEEPGANQVVERCRLVVDAWQPEGNLQSIRPTGWKLAWANNQIAVCVLDVEIELIRPGALTQEELEADGSIY
jgi:hypothetical protein